MKANPCTSLIGLMLFATASAATGQTITVTTSADVVDVPSTATIADLPGPDGIVSFSEAMIAANNTPGHQTIGFAIPASDWILQFVLPGRAVLHTVTGFYFRAFDEVTIDGTTQTAFTGDTNPDGNEIAIYGAELYLNADNCTLIGFDSTAVSVTGSNGVVQGNTGTMNITVYGGSGSLIQGNEGGTIKIDRSNANVVIENTVQRVRVLGFGMEQPAANNRIGGPNLDDRNYITGYGTWNSEGLPAGAAVQLVWTQGTLIENNWIGTTPDGLAQGNLACTMGISFQGENHAVTVRDNLIAGILGHGQGPHHAGQLFGWAIYFWGTASNIALTGNTIGLDADGNPALGSVWGVNVDNFSGYTLDGVSVVENVIAGHIFNGVRVSPTANMRLSANSIYDNGWLGIDLIPGDFSSGVSPNDPLDADAGANGLQNFPVLSAAQSDGATSTTVEGSLNSAPNASYRLEFFGNDVCHSLGFGEGQTYLGETTVLTDAGGDAAFAAVLPAPVGDGQYVTATATDPVGNTSEFSACLLVDYVASRGDCDSSGSVNLVDFATFSNCFGLSAPSGPCDAADLACSDLDENGSVDLTDFATFAVLYTGGS